MKLSNVRHICIVAAIFFILMILGCSSHPGGFSAPRGLTSGEKEIVAELGVNSAEIPANVNLTTYLTWAAIVWVGAQKKEIHYLHTYVPLMNAFDEIPSSASWYPTAFLSTGENGYLSYVVVDLPTRKVVDILTKTPPTVP